MSEAITDSHIENQWDDAYAGQLDPVDRLVYRSNLLGSDWRITNTGGGNTSSKLEERDPISGERTEILWVKGSGGDLRTARRANFASLYQDKLIELQGVYEEFDERGPKTRAEDSMVDMFRHCTFNLNARAPSIDTPLHSFIPYRHVDHTHPVACIAVATAENGEELTRQIYGDEVVWVDWLRPGFELGLKLQEAVKENPGARGVILGKHGLINWADDDKECYLLSLGLIEKAAEFLRRYDSGDVSFGGARFETIPEAWRVKYLYEILPFLRGQISRDKRCIATVQMDDSVLEFVNSEQASELAELGTSCPDHFLRTKIKPLYVEWNGEEHGMDLLRRRLRDGLDAYRRDYEVYYNEFRYPDSPPMRDPNPTIVLIPGIGMIAWGKTKSESRVTAEFYNAAMAVMKGAEAVSKYTALPKREAFDIEYWRLEEAKLNRMPPEKELSRRIVAVVGAGSGIGRALVPKLIREGATVAAIDLSEDAALKITSRVLEGVGKGIGVAGSGISGCGDVVGLQCDATNRESVYDALNNVVMAYGGLDTLVVTAGYYATPDLHGKVSDEDWAHSFNVNVTGAYYLADEASAIWRSQGLTGSMVITTSVNGVVSKRGSLAYDTSKAAANHLIRELAIELAPLIRVNGVAPATVVEGSTMFPRKRVIASLAKYRIPFNDDEDTEVLRRRLSEFYASRTLTQMPISPEDQAEAIFLLLSDRLSRTTGHIVPVDGGLVEAFMR